tara:strand:- start:25 stop:252 length:228 start_codon:yes stop_codon:yes gene_type:complete
MKDGECPFREGMMVLVFSDYERFCERYFKPAYNPGTGLIIEIFPLLQVANILLTDGTTKKRVPFTNIKILNEDGI